MVATNLTIRIDAGIKSEAEKLFDELGTLNSYINNAVMKQLSYHLDIFIDEYADDLDRMVEFLP